MKQTNLFKKILFFFAILLLGLNFQGYSQTMMPLPPHSTTYSGSVRGYWFVAPVSFTMTGLKVAAEAGPGLQSIQVMKIQGGGVALFPTLGTNFTTLFYVNNAPNNTIQAVSISVNAKSIGMEYPMICWNHGRPDKDGFTSDRTKFGMISVIVHEVGHNYFPMIVNSDERQWTWMDEGLNTFLQFVAEQDFAETYPQAITPLEKYPSRRGPAKNIIDYMAGDQTRLAPIMTKGLNTYNFGANAYAKPATALNILRETIMGRELFDFAFKTYANRWMFKHPTPEDFFRTMEDASAVDLDWYWREWFYTTDYVDIGVKEVKKFFVTSKMNKEVKAMMVEQGMQESDLPPLVYLVEEGSEDFEESMRNSKPADIQTLKDYIEENIPVNERSQLKQPNYFYEVTFEKPGGIPMPIIAEYTYSDGSSERVTYPAQIWRKNDIAVGKVIASEKEITKIVVDPDEETADIDTSNNSWPRNNELGAFDKFKNKSKSDK